MQKQGHYLEWFHEDHQKVMDALESLEEALENGDLETVGEIAEASDRMLGPHFAFEDDHLYPVLTRFFGEERVHEMKKYHYGASRGIARMKDLAAEENLSGEEVREARELLQDFYTHVADCDGLRILAMRLGEEEDQELTEAFRDIRQQDILLTELYEQ